MSRPTQDTTMADSIVEYETVTLYGRSFQNVPLIEPSPTSWSYNPVKAETSTVWALPRSLATTGGIICYFLFLRVLRCFSSPGSPLPSMYSTADTAEAVGCPIRKSTDQSLLAAPRGLSQRAASFIASQCQGIHQMPFRRLISTRFLRTPRAGANPHADDPREDASRPNRLPTSFKATALSGHPWSLILFTM